MKKIISLYLLIFSLNSFCQKINGTVFDENKLSLPGAIIYIDGTTFSTTSDENGNFVLVYDPRANNTLVIAYMGYQSQFIKGSDLHTSLDIFMKVSKIALKEVIINRKDLFTRAQKLKIFRENFIGKTQNSKVVTIQNEDDIYFKYDKENYVLKAFSDNPLVIINPSLGFKINYELIDFEVTFKKLSIHPYDVVSSFYQGLTRFEDINSSDEILILRQKTYQGSQVHFFRNLANNIWDKDEFLIYKDRMVVDPKFCFKILNEEVLTQVEVKSRPENNKSKNFVASYDLFFNKKEQSYVTFETNSFTIDKYGNNSNVENISFSSVISEKRVGDLLPLNYGIN